MSQTSNTINHSGPGGFQNFEFQYSIDLISTQCRDDSEMDKAERPFASRTLERIAIISIAISLRETNDFTATSKKFYCSPLVPSGVSKLNSAPSR
jgi:hypothetical protein